MFLFFILQLFFLIWRMCVLFVYYVSRFFSIYFFFSFLCRSLGFPSHPKTRGKKKRKIQNPNSKIEIEKRRNVSAQHVSASQVRLPNKCVCPPNSFVPKGSNFWTPSDHSFWCVVCPIFFLLSRPRCFTWNFGSWLVSPKNQDNFLFFANSPAQAGNHPKSVQSLAHKRFVSQKSGTKENWWEKFRESSA